MIRIAVALARLAGCETTPYQTTPLAGGIACGTSSCASGEVCVEQPAVIDAADGHDTASRFCFAPPAGCYVFNCHGNRCAPCMLDQCALFRADAAACGNIDVAERNVYCPGQ